MKWCILSGIGFGCAVLVSGAATANRAEERGSAASASATPDLPDGPSNPLPLLDGNARKLSFQARLTDGQGNALSGIHTLEFRLYDAPVGGVLVPGGGPFTVNVDIDANANGVVSTLFPDGDGVGLDVSVFPGEARYLGLTIDPPGAELSPRLLISVAPHAMRVELVGSEELADDVALGDSATVGSLTVFRNAVGTPSITLDGSTSRISTYGDGGIEKIRLWSTTAGELLLYDSVGNVAASLTAGGLGAQLNLRDGSGFPRILGDATSATLKVNGSFNLYDFPAELEIGRFELTTDGARLTTLDDVGNLTMQAGSASGAGGFAHLFRSGGNPGLFLDGGSPGRQIEAYNLAGQVTVAVEADDAAGAGRITLSNGTQDTAVLYAARFAFGGGRLELAEPAGNVTAVLTGDDDASAGELALWNDMDNQTVELNGDAGDDSADLRLSTGGGGAGGPGGALTVWLDADDGDGGGRITVHDSMGTETIRLDGQGNGGGSGLNMFNSLGAATVSIDADDADDSVMYFQDADANLAIRLHSDNTGDAAEISLYRTNAAQQAVETVEIVADETGDQGGQIEIRNASGVTTIELDGEYGAGGNGRVRTQVLEITGGADLSEQFAVHAAWTGGGASNPVASGAGLVPQPGMVVSIDPRHPGELVISTRAYDRTVAGIISGAGGLTTGMLMGQSDSVANGEYAVALTGRVYVQCDATGGAIDPGDLLTTSTVPGHAMRVAEHSRAQGAILGKAMTALPQGETGLVLVLVSLQ